VFAEPLAEAPATLVTAPAGSTPGEGDAAMARPTAASVSWRSVVAAGIPILWAVGALFVLARALAAHVAILRTIRRAKPAGGASASALADASERIGASARILASEEVDVPAVAGVLRPVILVPPGAADWNEATWRHVLLHELAHVRQLDTLGLALSQLGCAMHWYNPLSWWARRRLEAERELAADELVLATGALPSSYARTLLDVAVAAARPGAFAGGSIAAARGGIARRIETIASGIAMRPPSAWAARLLLLGAAAAGLGPGCVGAARETEGVTSAKGTAAQAPLVERVAGVVGTKPNQIELTIDPRVQRIAEEAVEELMQKWKPREATAIVIEPVSGQVLALTGTDLATRNVAPGSIFKLVTVAAAIDRNAVTPETRFDCGGGARTYGARTLTDAGSYGALSVREIVATSSNIGASRIFDALGGSELGYWLERTGFDETSPIELADLARPPIPREIEEGTIEGAQIAIGHQMPVSLLHLGAFYAAIANGGELPQLTLLKSVGGQPRVPGPSARILSDNTAKALRSMLDAAVNDERATGKGAQVAGFKVGGKTGTSGSTPEDTLTSFIGLAPIEDPKYVIVVSALGPQGDATGGRVAAPAFARIAAQLLGPR
jgi:beta-lactamase regulating signal transducer with metallopeptidase domain